MPQNDFRVFAGGATPNDGAPTTNTLSNAAYGTLASRTTGFQSGIARSLELNKVWRQSSIMSTMIAQFICDATGQNAIDDGTVPTLEAGFVAAIHAITQVIVTAPNLNYYVSTAGNDNNTGTSPSAPLRNIGTAIARVFGLYNFMGNVVTINVAGGTYAETLNITGQPNGCPQVTIVGNENVPSSVVINGGANNAINIFNTATHLILAGMTITAAGWGINCKNGSFIVRNFVFSSCVQPQCEVSGGSSAETAGNIFFAGFNNWGVISQTGSDFVFGNSAITFQSPNYNINFLTAQLSGTIQLLNTSIGGSFTGPAFISQWSSTINTFGAGQEIWPNNIHGSVISSTFGSYT